MATPPPVALPDDDALIAELRRLLREAADAGDQEARVFLEGTFEPWARERLAGRRKS